MVEDEDKLSNEIDSILELRKCDRCGAEFNLTMRQHPSTCDSKSVCDRCVVTECMECLGCIWKVDPKILIGVIKDLLNSVNIDEIQL